MLLDIRERTITKAVAEAWVRQYPASRPCFILCGKASLVTVIRNLPTMRMTPSSEMARLQNPLKIRF